ncbi:MAG: Hpt domain-containing protein [Thermoguttaceae bacterium]
MRSSDPGVNIADKTRLYGLFTSDIGLQMEAIETSLREPDRERAATAAHKLGGAAALFGFPELADAALAVEAKARRKASLRQIEEAVAKLARLCERLLECRGGSSLPADRRVARGLLEHV